MFLLCLPFILRVSTWVEGRTVPTLNSDDGRTFSNGTVACSTEFLSLSKLKIETEQDNLVSFGPTLLYFEVC